jgi:hypothetical protein
LARPAFLAFLPLGLRVAELMTGTQKKFDWTTEREKKRQRFVGSM